MLERRPGCRPSQTCGSVFRRCPQCAPGQQCERCVISAIPGSGLVRREVSRLKAFSHRPGGPGVATVVTRCALEYNGGSGPLYLED